MGKTVPSYRIAIESEIDSWKRFKDALRQEEQNAFDELMDLCRANAMAGSAACRPIIVESMTMTILLGQQLKIRQLQRQIGELKKQTST